MIMSMIMNSYNSNGSGNLSGDWIGGGHGGDNYSNKMMSMMMIETTSAFDGTNQTNNLPVNWTTTNYLHNQEQQQQQQQQESLFQQDSHNLSTIGQADDVTFTTTTTTSNQYIHLDEGELDTSIVNVTREYPLNYAMVMFGYIMPFVLIITLITNTLVVMVLYQRHMRTPTNIVLFTMAIVDLGTLLSPSPWYMYIYTFGNHDKFLYPPVACYAHHFMTDVIPVFFHTSSIWLALLLASQRYIYVCHPTLARTWCTVPRVKRAIFTILLIAFTHQFARFFDNKFIPVVIDHKQSQHYACKYATPDWMQTIGEAFFYTTYFMFRIFFVFLIPCVALITLNYLLFRALKRAENKRFELLKTKFKLVGVNPINGYATTQPNSIQSSSNHRQRNQLGRQINHCNLSEYKQHNNYSAVAGYETARSRHHRQVSSNFANEHQAQVAANFSQKAILLGAGPGSKTGTQASQLADKQLARASNFGCKSEVLESGAINTEAGAAGATKCQQDKRCNGGDEARFNPNGASNQCEQRMAPLVVACNADLNAIETKQIGSKQRTTCNKINDNDGQEGVVVVEDIQDHAGADSENESLNDFDDDDDDDDEELSICVECAAYEHNRLDTIETATATAASAAKSEFAIKSDDSCPRCSTQVASGQQLQLSAAATSDERPTRMNSCEHAHSCQNHHHHQPLSQCSSIFGGATSTTSNTNDDDDDDDMTSSCLITTQNVSSSMIVAQCGGVNGLSGAGCAEDHDHDNDADDDDAASIGADEGVEEEEVDGTNCLDSERKLSAGNVEQEGAAEEKRQQAQQEVCQPMLNDNDCRSSSSCLQQRQKQHRQKQELIKSCSVESRLACGCLTARSGPFGRVSLLGKARQQQQQQDNFAANENDSSGINCNSSHSCIRCLRASEETATEATLTTEAHVNLSPKLFCNQPNSSNIKGRANCTDHSCSTSPAVVMPPLKASVLLTRQINNNKRGSGSISSSRSGSAGSSSSGSSGSGSGSSGSSNTGSIRNNNHNHNHKNKHKHKHNSQLANSCNISSSIGYPLQVLDTESNRTISNTDTNQLMLTSATSVHRSFANNNNRRQQQQQQQQQQQRMKSPSFASSIGANGSRTTLIGSTAVPTIVSSNGQHGGAQATATTPAQSVRTMDSNRTTLMLVVVVTVFLVVEVPVAIVTILHVVLNLFDLFKDVQYRSTLTYIKLFTNFFIMISYSVNFTIYCSMSKKFRETFRDLWFCGRESKRKRDKRMLYQTQQQHSQYMTTLNPNQNQNPNHNQQQQQQQQQQQHQFTRSASIINSNSNKTYKPIVEHDSGNNLEQAPLLIVSSNNQQTTTIVPVCGKTQAH